MDRRRAGALLALAACVACTAAAPTASNQTALDLYDGGTEGCFYNFQHYGEGDRIMTNEPCLNCTCHNRMLMCYLRVCPFTKPIGQDCTVEKRADQCCPIVTCPDVPVDLLTSTSTTSPAEYGATGLGKLDKFGCSIEGKYFPEGSKVPPTPNKPCEHCYCIRNMTTCVMQECTLHVDGCTPIYHKDVCCPVRYSCDHPEDEMPLLDDMSTTVRPTPGFLLTTTTIAPVTQMTQDCVHDDQIFADGALIKTEKACEHCYCMKGDIVCVVQECGTPMENEGKNCTSLPPREGQCCPDTYICEGDDLSTESTTETEFDTITTLSPPRRSSVEGSGYRNEPDEAITFTKMPTQQPEYEGSGEEQITIQPSDELEKLPSTDEEPSDEIHKLSTISEMPSEIDQPKATTEPSVLHTTSEQTDLSNIDKDESSLPVTIEPQEYIPASTSGFADKEDETTEDYLMTAEPEDLASHHHMPSSAVTEKYNDISTEAGEDLNTVPIEENLETHKHVPTSHDVVEKQTDISTPSVIEKQTEPEERVSSTSSFAESTESTKLAESDVTTKTEMHDIEKDVPSTVGSIIDEVEKETIKMHDVTTESYPSSALSVAGDENAKSTTEPDHSQNTVMTAEEDDVAGTKPSDKVNQNTTPQSVESGSGEEDIDEENIVVPHEHGTTILPSQQEDIASTVERESELPDKTLQPSDDETKYKTTIQSSTSPSPTTAIKGDQSTTTTEPSFRKEDKIAVTSEKSDRPEVTTSKSDLTEEEFIPASPHDEKLSTGVLVTDDESSTLQPDYVIDSKEPTITSSTEYSILTETKPAIPADHESELEPGTGSGSLPDITTEVSDIEVHQEPSRIPGEGDCLLDSITYTNNSRVPSNNKCYSGCKCVSSIIKCDPIICSPPPDYMHNCQSIYDTPDSCCPTYVCDHPRETAPPQSDNQMSVTESPITSSSIECRGDQCEIITETKKPETTESDQCGPQGCEGGEIKPADTQLASDHSDKCQGDECGISSTDCSNGDCQSPQVPDQICDPEHGCQAAPVRPCEGEHCKDTIEPPAPLLPSKCEKAADCADGKTQQTAAPSSETQQESCKDDQNCTQQPQKEEECTEESCKKVETVPLEEQIISECKDDQCVHKLGTNTNEIVDSKDGSSDQSTPLPDIGTTPIAENTDASEVFDSHDTPTKQDKPYETETEKTEDTDKNLSELTTVTPEITENIYPTEPSDIHKETYTNIPEQPITDLEHEIPSEGYQTTILDVSGQTGTTTSYKTDMVETSTFSQDVTPSRPSEIPLPSHTDDQKQDNVPTAVPEDVNYATDSSTLQFDLDNKQYTTTSPGDEKTIKAEENLYTTIRQEPSKAIENKDTSQINEIVTTQKSVADETYESSTVGFSLPSENEQDIDKLVTISAEKPVTDAIVSDIPTVEPMTTNLEGATLSSVDQEKISTEVPKLEPHVTKPQESSETHEFTTKSSNVFEITTEVETIATKSPEIYVTEGIFPENPQTEQQHITEITTSATKPDESFTEIEDSFVTGSEEVTTERQESEISDIYERPKPTTTIISDVTGSQEISTKSNIVPDEYITVTPSIPHIDKSDDSITERLEPLLPTENVLETESPEYVTRKPDTTIIETVQTTEKSDLGHKTTEQISESDQSTEALITELLIPVEPVKTKIPEKTSVTPNTENNEVNVPQGPETYTTDEPEIDTEEPVMSPEKEYSEIPIENVTEQPQKIPEEIDSHRINTDVPSYTTPKEVTPELDIKLQESLTEKPPAQTTDTTVDEMRTELPIDQEPETLVTLSQDDSATPFIPYDKISTESPKETVTEIAELPGTTVFISEEITKSPLKESEDKTVTVTPEEPKPDTGSSVSEESATKPSVYDIFAPVTEIPETETSEDETQTPKPSKESDIKITTQQEIVTSVPGSANQPEVSNQGESTPSENTDKEDKAPEEIASSVTELAMSQESVTSESEDTNLNAQPDKDDEHDVPNILESTTLEGQGLTTKGPHSTDVPGQKELLVTVPGGVTTILQEEIVTKTPEITKLPEIESTQEDLVTKTPEHSGTEAGVSKHSETVTSEGPTEETITVIPDSTKSDDVATKLPEYSGMTAIDVTKQEEIATASIQEEAVTKASEYTNVPEDEKLTKTPDSETPGYEESITKSPEFVTESDINVTTKEEQVTQRPQDESPSSVTESVATITSIPETTVGYEAHITQQSVVTTVEEQIVTESPNKMTESQDIPKDTITETPGKLVDPEIVVTVQAEVTPKTPELMKDPESLVTGQDDMTISTALPTTDNKQPETSDTRRHEQDTASQENAKVPVDDHIKQSEKPLDVNLPETKVTAHDQISTNIEFTSQYYDNQEEVTETYKPEKEIPVTISPDDKQYSGAETTESTKDAKEKEQSDNVTKVPDTTELISSEEKISTKSPEDTKYVDEEVTGQDSVLTTSPEYGTDITKEHEYVTKMPGLGEESEVTRQEENIPEKVETEAPIIDIVTEKQEHIPPHEESTTEQLGDIQTTPELVILEEHTHKPALEASSTLPPFEDEVTTVIDEIEEHMPETSSQIPPIESTETVAEDIDITTVSSSLAQEKLTTIFEPTTFEQKPTIHSEQTLSTDLEDKEITTPSSLVPQDSEKSPIPDVEGEVQSETVPLNTEYPPTSESMDEALTIQPTTERQEEKLVTPGLNIITPSESDEYKPSEDKPSKDKSIEDTQSEGKPSEDKSTESKPSDEQSIEGKPSDESSSEDKTGEESPGEEKPSEEKPSEDKTGESKPSQEKPSEESASEDETGEGKPSDEKPSEDKTGEGKPSEESPSEEKPTKDKTSEGKPSEESASDEKPSEDKTGEGKPSEESPSEEKPTKDKTSEGKPSEEKPSDDKTSEGKPTEESSSEDKTGEGKPSEESPSEEKPSEEKPSEEKPSEDKTGEGKPNEESSSEDEKGEGKPSEEIPSEGKPSEESPNEEKPTEDKTGEIKPSEEKPGEDKTSEEKPSEESPSEEEPSEDKTGEGKPSEESPSEEEPNEDKTSEIKSSEEKPGEDTTGEGKPTEDETGESIPSEEKPIEDKTGAIKPSEDTPTDDKTSEGKPSEESPSEEEPSEDKPSKDKTDESKPSDESPSEEKPTEEKTGEGKPSEEGPSDEEPSEDKTSETKPIEDKTDESKPSEESPSEEKPTEDKTSGGKPSEEKPSDDKTSEGKPTEESSSEDKTGEGKPSEESPTEESPTEESPSEDKTNKDKPSEDKADEIQPSEESPSEEMPSEDKPSDGKPSEESQSEEKPSEENPSEEKPSEGKPSEDSSSEEKPGEGKPSEESSNDEKPGEGKPSEEKPSEDTPTDDKTGEGKPSHGISSEGKPTEDKTGEEKPSDEKPSASIPAEEKPIEPSEPTAETPKPITSVPQATDELPTPEEDGYFPPSGMGYGEPEDSEEDQAFGPGTCRYGGKVYVSAQQIPRDDPCDFCFCFRSDIICLQQSCPPPIHGCHEEPIQGFCCPRYECPVSMATTVNVTTTTTTTTTTLPPHFPTHSYKGAAQRRGCQIKGHTYKVGEVVRSASGPCLHCTCGGDGQMKCDPKACTPEPMLRQMIAAAVSAKRRR